ncbi:MAG: hypothetical protein AAF799_28765 [Myxococcota bacterium]
MDKVLCERPRGGRRLKRRSSYRGPLEEAPYFESNSRHRGGTKWLSEHLGPLRRWLRSQVGRPWDAVYSELRQNISASNAVQMHIWQHAQDFVARQVVVLDGQVYREPGEYWGTGLMRVWSYRTPVYVCPQTGLVKPTPIDPRKPSSVDERRRIRRRKRKRKR